MRALTAAKPASGNMVLVTHESTIHALTAVSLATGEIVLISHGKVAGRISFLEV
jgi:hypothetical protein